MAENVIDNLSIEVTSSADKAASMFDRLASSAGRVKGAASGAAGGMQDMAQGARDAGTATQEAETQSGRASTSIKKFWDSLKSVGSRIGSSFVNAVHRGTAAIGNFIHSIARIAFYRAIRSILKDLGQSFKDLYGYSRLFGTDFSKSMDQITTASVYLRNSLAAMVAPLINMFAPALDMLADKIVDILNFVNQLFAAINGQTTYTVAKKIATTWESTFDTAANHANRRIKEVKNSLLGFDEINRLNGATPAASAGSTGKSPYTPGYETMFEEKPLEGFFRDISNVTSGMPDWLKWLLGGTALIGGFLLIKKFLPWLLSKIKDLFALNIPNWLKWLFGGGDKDKDKKIKIDIPDEKVKVDLEKGDWSVMDELADEDVNVPVKLGKSGWNTLSEFVGIYSPLVYVRLGKAAWTTLSDFVGIYSPLVYVRLGKAGWSTLSDFVGLYSPLVYVRLGKAGWTSLSQFVGIYSPLVYVRLGKAGWTSLADYVGEYSPLVYVRLGKSAWTTLSAFVGIYSPIVYVRLGKTAWTTLEDYVGKYEAEVPVRLSQSWRGSALNALGLDNLDATAFINAITPWDYYGVMRYLGLDDLYAIAWVDVTTPWWQAGKHILDWLGLTNLHTTVTINTRTVNNNPPTGGGGSFIGGSGAGRGRAKGGIYANGRWSEIPQYANGTLNAGTIFAAGEAGPEIVGHVGGRTEVLNKSQIASAIYSAVQAAMAPATSYFAAAAQSISDSSVSFDLEALAEMVRMGVEQAMSRSNDYDRQKVELLRSINDKDFNVDVSTASINKAQSRMNRRAGTTIVPVGT